MATQITVPGVHPFHPHGDPNKIAQTWDKWQKSFQYFLDASGITNYKRKKAMLLHMAGPETQEVFDTLTPANDTYDKALEALTSHFSVKKNVPFERNVFHQTKQKAGESVKQFVTRLRKLTASCEYGDQTEDQIRDQVIATCSSTGLRKKLLTEPDLTLAKVIEIAQVMETAHHQVKEIEAKHEQPFLQTPSAQNDEDYLNFLRWKNAQHQKTSFRKGQEKFQKSCWRCGAKGHYSSECRRSKDVFCEKCKKKGRFTKMCRSKGKTDTLTEEKQKRKSANKDQTSHKTHQEAPSDNISDENDVYMFHIESKLKSALHPIKIGTQKVNLLIDSGSTLNILDEPHFYQLNPPPVLHMSNAKIFPYQAQEQLKILGTFKAHISSNDRTIVARFHVVRGKGGAILGKETAEKLDLLRVGPVSKDAFPVNTLSSNTATPLTMDILERNATLFSGTGKLKNFQLKLHINPDFTPVQQPIRRIPFHTRKKVEESSNAFKSWTLLSR